MPRNDEIIIVIARFIYKSKQSIFWNCAFLNNKAVLTPCLLISELLIQGAEATLLLGKLTNSDLDCFTFLLTAGFTRQLPAFSVWALA